MAKAKTDVKLIVLGAASVGKTCLLQRYLTGNFAETLSSIGASLALKKWEDWNVALWDTAGEERYASLSSFYCRGASVAILAFDITSKHSFEKLQEVFIPLLEESVPSCLTVIVGTKLDLVASDGRQVQAVEGYELARKEHAKQVENSSDPDTFLKALDTKLLYIETSSKTGEGVDKLFETIRSILLPQLQKTAGEKKAAGSQPIQLSEVKKPPKDSKCC